MGFLSREMAAVAQGSRVSLSRHLGLLGVTGLALLCLCSPVWALDGRVRDIHFDSANRHFQIDTAGPVKATVNALNIAGHKRIIIDLDNAEIGTDLPRDAQLLQDLSRSLPNLRNLTVNQYSGNGRPIVRILMDIQGDPGSIRIVRNQGPRIELELNDVTFTARSQPSLSMPPSLAGLQKADPAPTVREELATTPPVSGPPVAGQSASSSGTDTDAASETKVLRQTLVNLNSKYENVLQENRYLNTRLRSLEQNRNNSQTEQQRFQNEQKALQSELDNLKATNASLKQQVASLSAQASRPDPALAEKEADIHRLESENQSLQSQITQLQNASQKASSQSQSMDAMKRALVEMDRRYSLLSQEAQSLKQKTSQQSLLTSELAANKSTISRLQADNKTLQSKIDQLMTANKQEDKADAQAAALQSAQAKALADSKGMAARLQEENQALRDKVSQLLATNTQQSTLKTETATLKSKVEDLQREAESLRLDNQSLKNQLASKPSGPAITENELGGLRNQLTVAQQSLSNAIRTINEQNKEIAYLRNQVNNVKSGMDAASREEVERLQSQLKSLKDEQGKKDTTIQDLQRQLAAKSKPTATATGTTGETTRLKGQLDQLTRKHEAELADLNRLLQAKNDELKLANSRAAEAAQASQVTAMELEKLKSGNTNAKPDKELAALKAELAEAKQALKQQQGSKSQVSSSQKADLATAKSELARVQNQYEQLRTESKTLEQELATARAHAAELEKASTEKSNSGSSQADASQLASLNRQLDQLRTENKSLRESLTNQPAQHSASNAEAEGHYKAGKAALEAKNMKVAIDKLKTAHLLDSNNADYAIDYSIALAEEREYAESIDVLRRYLQRHPSERDVYNQLGKLYLLNDQPDAASQAFNRAIPVSTLNNYATSLKKLGNMKEAESVFNLALTMNPKDSEVLFNLGNLYNAQDKLELARNKYLEAIQMRPDFAEAHYNLGLVFSKLGDNPKAVIHLEKFLQLSPNARNAETIRAYVQRLKA